MQVKLKEKLSNIRKRNIDRQPLRFKTLYLVLYIKTKNEVGGGNIFTLSVEVKKLFSN